MRIIAHSCRGVAQSGSALAWGARGREFESRRPDHFFLISREKKLKIHGQPNIFFKKRNGLPWKIVQNGISAMFAA